MFESDSCEKSGWKRYLLINIPEVKAEEGRVRKARYMELEGTYQLGTDSIVSFKLNKFMQ